MIEPKFWAIVLVLINICVCIADKEIVHCFCYLDDDVWRSCYVSRLIDFTWRSGQYRKWKISQALHSIHFWLAISCRWWDQRSLASAISNIAMTITTPLPLVQLLINNHKSYFNNFTNHPEIKLISINALLLLLLFLEI